MSVVIPFEKIPSNMLNPFLQHLRENPEIDMSSVRKVFDECVSEEVPEVNRQRILKEQLSIYFFGLNMGSAEMSGIEVRSLPLLGKYRHYKGNEYTFICLGKSTVDLSPLVIYSDAASTVWVRPYEEFMGSVMHEGQLTKRFTWLGSC